jgi:YidC/Oxa1 family membrane protein insertase
MNPLTFVYHEILYRPLFNLLVGITNILPTHSVGLSIILVTAVVRIILFPSALHQARHLNRNQQKMEGLKREVKAINEKYKDNPTERSQATMALYRRAGINPVAGCLPLLVQLPILLALYQVFLRGLGPDTWGSLYSFIGQPTALGLTFFGINLGEPSIRLAIAAGIAQFIQMRFLTPTPPTTPGGDEASAKMMAGMQRNMMYIFPVMTVFISIRLPAALALYWLVSTLFGMVQYYIIRRFTKIAVGIPIV